MALENACFQQHAWGYFTFKHLLGCSDDRTLPLVEKSAIQWVFGLKTAFNCRQGPEHSCFSVQPLLCIMKGMKGITQ